MGQAIGLKLSAKREVCKGTKYYKILSFSCYDLDSDELPHVYFEKYPYCCETEGMLMVATNDKEYVEKSASKASIDCCVYKVGDLIPQDEFDKLLKILHVCGEKLHDINISIKEMRSEWQGVEEFNI